MAARKQEQDKFKPVDLERGGKSRTARTADEVVRLRFEGWRAKNAKKAGTTPQKPADK